MPEKSLNSLSGLLSTKELPTTSMQKSTNNSLQGNHGENSFPAKLASTMKNSPILKGQGATLAPSKLNYISSNEAMNHLMEAAPMSVPTNTETIIDGNQMQLNYKLDQNTPGETLAYNIIKNIPDVNTTPEPIQLNALPGNAYLNNQGPSALTESSINLTKIVQDVVEKSYLGQSATNSTEKLNINQSLADMNELNNIDILGKLDLVKVAGEKAGLDHIFQESGNLNRQTLTLDSKEGSDNKIQEQLTAQVVSKTVLLNPDTDTLLQQGTVQAKNNEPPATQAAPKADTVSFGVGSGINGNRPEAIVSQVKTSPDNSFSSNQVSYNIKEPNINTGSTPLETNSSQETLLTSKAPNGQTLKPEVMFESREGSNNKIQEPLTSPVANKTVSINPNTDTLLQQSTVQAGKAPNGQTLKPKAMFESGQGSNNKIREQLTSQVANKTVSINPNTDTLLQQGTVQAKNNVSPATQAAHKADTVSFSGSSGSNGNRPEAIVSQAKTLPDNIFSNSMVSHNIKELSIKTGGIPQKINNSQDTLQTSKAPNGQTLKPEVMFESRQGSNNKILEQLISQVTNKTVSINPNTNTLLQQGTVQAKNNEPLAAQTAPKADTVSFSGSSGSNGNRPEAIVSQAKTLPDNIFSNSMVSHNIKELSIKTGGIPQKINNSQNTLQTSKAPNGQALNPEVLFESRQGSNNKILEQLISQVTNKTVSINPNTDTLLQQGTVQAKNNNFAAQAASNVDTVTLRGVSGINGDRLETIVNRIKASMDNSLSNNQISYNIKEPNINTGRVPQEINNSQKTLQASKVPNDLTLKPDVMFESSEGSNSRILEQLRSQVVNKTILIDPNTNTLFQRGAVEVESNKPLTTPNAPKADNVDFRGVSGINGDKLETIINRIKPSMDNSLSNNQISYNIKEPNINTGRVPQEINNSQDTLQASKVPNDQTLKPEVLSDSSEGSNNKIQDQLKEQYPDNTSLAKSGTNSSSQQSSIQAKAAINETPKIFDISPTLTEANISKSSDNMISNNSNGVININTGEQALQANTSSNNSSFGNQSADTINAFYINPVNTGQKIEQDTNFTNTLSQINNTTNTTESLSEDISDNIIQKAKLFMRGGRSEVKILLNPQELGTLKLEFTAEGDSLDAKITVERSAVKDVIEKDILKLRELISNADIDVGKLDVFLQDKGEGKMSFMNKDLQSGSKNNSTQDFQNQDKEYFENDIEEESIASNADSNQINYLV